MAALTLSRLSVIQTLARVWLMLWTSIFRQKFTALKVLTIVVARSLKQSSV